MNNAEQILSQLVVYINSLRASRMIPKSMQCTSISPDFLAKYHFKGFVEIGRNIVPTWTINPSLYSRSKYIPHQKTRECARRKKQLCTTPELAFGQP